MNTEIRVSGRTVNGVVAPYDFSIRDVIGEGWSKVYGCKSAIMGALGFYIFISMVAGFVAGTIGTIFHSEEMTKFFSIIFHFVLYPMAVGMLMMGIRRAVDLPIEAKMVFHYFKNIWRISGVFFLSSLIVGALFLIGAISLFIVIDNDVSIYLVFIASIFSAVFMGSGIYLGWAYLFAIPLTVEKNLPIWRSLEVSRKGVTKHWWKLFATSCLIMVIYLLSMLPLCLGLISPLLTIPAAIWLVVSLIWLIPFVFTTRGVLYRVIFGVEGLT